jgi:hypothetical protein
MIPRNLLDTSWLMRNMSSADMDFEIYKQLRELREWRYRHDDPSGEIEEAMKTLSESLSTS